MFSRANDLIFAMEISMNKPFPARLTLGDGQSGLIGLLVLHHAAAARLSDLVCTLAQANEKSRICDVISIMVHI